MTAPVLNPLADHVWRSRYRLAGDGRAPEDSLDSTFGRVAAAVAAGEPDPAAWRQRFAAEMSAFRLLPGGRILAGAGAGGQATLLNCFVMAPLEGSLGAIFDALGLAARTLAAGGGIGCDFSALPPRAAAAGPCVASAPGPVAWMRLWDATCATVTGMMDRSGAMMATLDARHPDILEFVDAKCRAGVLPHFNLSVRVDDAFLAAAGGSGGSEPGAAQVWDHIVAAALEAAEPGLLFTSTINEYNNLRWCERLTATNPCGEAPLPAWGCCALASLNLAAFVRNAFESDARLDLDALDAAARTGVRLLDDVLDVARYPLEMQRAEALRTRRVGLGITGLADALAMLGLRYDIEAGRDAAAGFMERIKLAAYRASIALARERGPFPAFQREPYLGAPFVAALPGPLRDELACHGIRNSHLLAVAPAGSISLLANNVSPGMEPIPALRQRRQVRVAGGDPLVFEVEDHAWSQFRDRGGDADGAFVEARDVSPEAQVELQAALQRHVDGAVSKTVTLPPDCTSERLSSLLLHAHRLGVKGLAVYRPGTVRGAVLSPGCRGPASVECDPG